MTTINMPNKNLNDARTLVYTPCSFEVSSVQVAIEGSEYDACQFELNGRTVICRSAKITPKKSGQFVTCWKRNISGITEPYSEKDAFHFYVIHVRTEKRFGQFVFPKSELIKQGILRTDKKDGKRGFRIYPPWDEAQNGQAIRTQKWQLNYFLEIGSAVDLTRAAELYEVRGD